METTCNMSAAQAAKVLEAIKAFRELTYKGNISMKRAFPQLPAQGRQDMIARANLNATRALTKGSMEQVTQYLGEAVMLTEWQTDIMNKRVEVERLEGGAVRILRNGKDVTKTCPVYDYEATVDFNNVLWSAKDKVKRLYDEACSIFMRVQPLLEAAQAADKARQKAQAAEARRKKKEAAKTAQTVEQMEAAIERGHKAHEEAAETRRRIIAADLETQAAEAAELKEEAAVRAKAQAIAEARRNK